MTKFLKNDTVMKWVIFGMFAILTGINGWGLAKVASIPETYVTKPELSKRESNLQEQICDVRDALKVDLHELKVDVNKNIENVDKKVDKRLDKVDSNIEVLRNLIIEHMDN